MDFVEKSCNFPSKLTSCNFKIPFNSFRHRTTVDSVFNSSPISLSPLHLILTTTIRKKNLLPSTVCCNFHRYFSLFWKIAIFFPFYECCEGLQCRTRLRPIEASVILDVNRSRLRFKASPQAFEL